MCTVTVEDPAKELSLTILARLGSTSHSNKLLVYEPSVFVEPGVKNAKVAPVQYNLFGMSTLAVLNACGSVRVLDKGATRKCRVSSITDCSISNTEENIQWFQQYTPAVVGSCSTFKEVDTSELEKKKKSFCRVRYW